MRFNTPLPGIEAISSRADSGSGWQWVHRDGNTLATPEYSPLHPQVAEEMIYVASRIAELGSQYGSFAGLVVRLGEDSYTLLAGEERGYDNETVDRFLGSLDLQWPEEEQRSPEAHATVIENNVADAWRRWRYQQLTSIYSQIAERAMAANPAGVGLLMTPEGVLNRSAVRSEFTPRLGTDTGANELLLELGLLPPKEEERLLPLAAPVSQSLHSSLEQGAISQSSADALQNELTRVGGDQAMQCIAVVTQPVELQLHESSRLLKTSNQEDLLLLANPLPASGALARLISTVATHDSTCLIEGGVAAGGLLDDSTAELRRQVASLPLGSAAPDSIPEGSEVVTRVFRTETSCIVVVINPTSWPSQASVTVEANERSLVTPYDPTEIAEWCEVGRHVVAVDLAPHSLKAWTFSTAEVQVLGVRTQPRPDAENELLEALENVRSRDRTAQRPFEMTPNPSFELREEDGLPSGWNYDNGEEESLLSIPATGAADGNHALRLAAGQSVRSRSFPQPRTGQFVLLFQAQGYELSEEAALRIDIDSPDGGYHVHTIVQAEQIASGDVAWRPVIFGVDDLPLDSNAELTLRFSFEGEGVIWIDQLQAESLLLPIEAYSEQLRGQKLALVKLIHAAESALEEGRLAKCQELLDSYWIRFLTVYFPTLPVEDQAGEDLLAAEEEAPAETEVTPDAEEEEPSMADRVKGWFWK